MQASATSQPPASKELEALQTAEQGLLSCLVWAAETVEELGKVKEADRALIEDRSGKFLKTLKEVETTLAAAIKRTQTAEFAGSDSVPKQEAPDNSPSFIPKATATYLSKPYWDERFANEDSYEWCKSFEEFGNLLLHHFAPFSSVLEIGAGNSSLSTSLTKKLPTIFACSLDLSQVVAERMRDRQAADGTHIDWQVGDMLSLPFCNDCLDVVIEKGALDVFLVDRGSPWDPAPAAAARMHTALSEIHRVLREGGKFISITFDQPHFRKPFLKAPGLNWNVQLQTFGEGLEHTYCYMPFLCRIRRSYCSVPAR
ncbi:hypothetical protein WJX74_008266 [Apatococcus lobatus]|uniref:Methyltransferase domain-containing protein n=1 Tax=Apatococcus lobatus TaxID=904363 RepID=A0AAW1RJW3_9CHLO